MDGLDREDLHRVLAQRGGFGHREHLELAWTYLSRHSAAEAEQVMAQAIRYVAELHGAADRYHETITRSWLRLVAIHRQGGAGDTFDEFMEHNSGLLNRQLLDRHYSSAELFSDRARREWLAPDLIALPTHA